MHQRLFKHDKISDSCRSRDKPIERGYPVPWTVCHRSVAKLRRRKWQHDPAPQPKALGLFETNNVGAARRRCY
jgi:hypothetical protein